VSWSVKGSPWLGSGRGRAEGMVFFFQVVFGWRVDCSLSTWTVDSRLPIQVFLLFFVWGGGGVMAKISQSMFSEFPIASHFYPICFGIYYPPFTYIGGPKGRATLYFKVKLSILGSFQRFFFF
jgi:hypothetical protein